jgi:hypothetical protein
MEFAEQRRLSFQEKLASLESNFESWEQIAQQGQPFRKHNRQLREIFFVLRRMLAQVKGLGQGDQLSGLRNGEKGLLAVHRIWEYFRGKLSQRRDPLLRSYLQFADELAWACYSPIQQLAFPDAANGQLKAPPLVYLNGGMSPFALTRADRFSAEEVAGEPLDKSWQSITGSLPVPVIGVPWYQAERVFDTLVIVHEVGHIVEKDFKLEKQIADLLNGAVTGDDSARRLRAWQAWQSEVFADVFGCLCAGPAFVNNLLETIAVDAEAVRDEFQVDEQWDKYPTLFLRGLLNIAALERLCFKTQAADLKSKWRTLYPTHGMEEFERDVHKVAASLLDGPYPLWNGSLRDAVRTADIDAAARQELKRLREGGSPQSRDFRVLFAVARLAYEENRALDRIHLQNLFERQSLQVGGVEGTDGKAIPQCTLVSKCVIEGARREGRVARQHDMNRASRHGARDCIPNPRLDARRFVGDNEYVLVVIALEVFGLIS